MNLICNKYNSLDKSYLSPLNISPTNKTDKTDILSQLSIEKKCVKEKLSKNR